MMRFLLPLLFLLLYSQQSYAGEKNLYIGFYGAQGSDNDFVDLLALQYESMDTYLYAVTLSKRFPVQKERYSYEVEAQIVKHVGMQDHFEVNTLVIYRWLKLPWDHIIDTSLAIGDGFSYAFEKPQIELDKQKTSKILNYLMAEVTFSDPCYPNLELFTRIHHRSGMYGLINNVKGGSNFVAVGFRYRL